MTLDIDDVATRLAFALRRAVGAELPGGGPAGGAKARALAQYASMISDAYAAGSLDDEEMRQELVEIAHMTRRYAGAIQGVAGAVAEHAKRSAVEVVFGALRASLSFAGAPLPQGLTAVDSLGAAA